LLIVRLGRVATYEARRNQTRADPSAGQALAIQQPVLNALFDQSLFYP
jgi:hypothetical protein